MDIGCGAAVCGGAPRRGHPLSRHPAQEREGESMRPVVRTTFDKRPFELEQLHLDAIALLERKNLELWPGGLVNEIERHLCAWNCRDRCRLEPCPIDLYVEAAAKKASERR